MVSTLTHYSTLTSSIPWALLALLDDHTGGCGCTRVTGSRGLPPLPGHETVSQSPLAPTSVLTISNELYWIKRIPKFDVRVL